LVRTDADAVLALDGAFRVYMTPQDMALEGLATGDYICIQSESTLKRGVAIAWRATDSLGSKSQGNPVLRASDLLRISFGFELKDGYSISKWNGQLPMAREVTVMMPANAGDQNKGVRAPGELEFWIPTALGKRPLRSCSADAFQSHTRQLSSTAVSTLLPAPDQKRNPVRDVWSKIFFPPRSRMN
jgi:hypothetical protein